eukprot:gene9338-biopygen8893
MPPAQLAAQLAAKMPVAAQWRHNCATGGMAAQLGGAAAQSGGTAAQLGGMAAQSGGKDASGGTVAAQSGGMAAQSGGMAAQWRHSGGTPWPLGGTLAAQHGRLAAQWRQSLAAGSGRAAQLAASLPLVRSVLRFCRSSAQSQLQLAARRHSLAARRQRGAAWRHGGMAAKLGGTAAKTGGTAARRHGGTVAAKWRQSLAARRHSGGIDNRDAAESREQVAVGHPSLVDVLCSTLRLNSIAAQQGAQQRSRVPDSAAGCPTA